MRFTTRRGVFVGTIAVVLAPALAFAQDETIRIVYPFAAGGTGDSVIRLIAEQMQKNIGTPVIVENRGGAGGRLGAMAVKNAAPNGRTLLFAGMSQVAILPHLYPNLGFDPLADFIPISRTVQFDLGLAVSAQIPVRSIPELVAWLKQNPDKASYGSPGAGSLPFFVGTEFSRIIGQNLSHVAYRGTPAALPDLLAGRIPLFIAGASELVEQHKSGGVRLLAITGETRSKFLPDIPTLRESGIALDAPTWFGFYAPAGIPTDVAERLEQRVIAATLASEVSAKILALGYEPIATTSEAFKKIQRAEYDRWGVIVRASGFKPEPE